MNPDQLAGLDIDIAQGVTRKVHKQLVGQLLQKVWKQFEEGVHPFVGVCGIAWIEASLQDRVIQLQQPVYAQRIALCATYKLVCLVTAYLLILCNLSVWRTGFLQLKKLLEPAHANDSSCHITLPVMFEAKLGDSTCSWPTMLRKGLAFNLMVPANGRQCSGKMEPRRRFQVIFAHFTPIFIGRRASFLACFRLDLLADHGPDYVKSHAHERILRQQDHRA